MLQANKLSHLVNVTFIGNMLHPDWTAYKYFCEVLPCRCPQQLLYNKCFAPRWIYRAALLRLWLRTKRRHCERSEATGSKWSISPRHRSVCSITMQPL